MQVPPPKHRISPIPQTRNVVVADVPVSVVGVVCVVTVVIVDIVVEVC